ncbi:hypothetical protein DER45DRAFT_476401 [Fusarium avenaceum]|nr:hypothetical protein DER45DRAFT_476401 [Fusarium avenaceum]
MESFNPPQDQRNGANMSPQTVEQNENLAALGQPRTHTGTAFWQQWGGDDPWNPLTFGTPSDGQARSQLLEAANFQYHDYRSKPLISECDTNPEDSTYGSRLTHSIGNPSTYGEDIDPDLQALESQNPEDRLVNASLETLQLHCQPPTDDPQLYPAGGSPQLYQTEWTRPLPPASVATAPVGRERRWACNDCRKLCRTRSELRKHELKHSLPWHCNVSGCARDKGFTSKNDLDRHKRTVHGDRTVSGRTFVCNIGNCAKKSKYWPRADNFRSHLLRIHSKTYLANDDLSEYVHRPAPSQDLEGIGGSAIAYLQAQEQSSSSIHPSTSLSFRGPYDDRRASQPLPSISSLSRGPSSVSFDRDASSLATVREGDENYIQPGILSGSGYLPPHPWSASTVSEEDAPGDDITASESEQQGDTATEAMGGVQKSGTSDTEISSASEDLTSQQPDVRMTDTDEAEATPRAISSQTDLSESSSSTNPEKTYELLDRIPKDLIADYLRKHSMGSRDDTPKPDLTSNKSQTHSHKCSDCPKTFPRLCELKKHKKRHSKPYGCTFADCKKKFGSKNDWKRHESIQHYQLETWTCDCTKSGLAEPCGKVCYRRESFRSHLTKDHPTLDPQKLEEKIDSCRKGRHCETYFWCGFCLKTVNIEVVNNSWAKRFDHIDDHFSGRGGPKKYISEWVHEKDRHAATIASQETGSGSSSGSSTSDPKSPRTFASQDHNSENYQVQKMVYMWECVSECLDLVDDPRANKD